MAMSGNNRTDFGDRPQILIGLVPGPLTMLTPAPPKNLALYADLWARA